MFQLVRQEVPINQRVSLLATLRNNQKRGLKCKTFKAGQPVTYAGLQYWVLDFQADLGAPNGVLLHLVARDLTHMIECVPQTEVA